MESSHQTSPTGAKPFYPRRSRKVKEGRDTPCPYCDKSFFRINSLLFHMRKKHMGQPDIHQTIVRVQKRPRNAVKDLAIRLSAQQNQSL